MDPSSTLGGLAPPVLAGLLLALLAVAAGTDLRQRRIPNLCSAGLMLLLPFWMFWTGRPAAWHEAVLALALVALPCLLLWGRAMLGGGDVKLAVACAGFMGTADLLPFLLLTSLLGGVLALGQVLLHRPPLRLALAMAHLPGGGGQGHPTPPPGQTVPYGVAIAVAAGWLLLVPLLPQLTGRS